MLINIEYRFKFFPQKNPIPLNLNQKNWFWQRISPHTSSSMQSIVSKNHRVHPQVDPHLPCEFHENWFKTANCIVCSHIKLQDLKSVIGLKERENSVTGLK